MCELCGESGHDDTACPYFGEGQMIAPLEVRPPRPPANHAEAIEFTLTRLTQIEAARASAADSRELARERTHLLNTLSSTLNR